MKSYSITDKEIQTLKEEGEVELLPGLKLEHREDDK